MSEKNSLDLGLLLLKMQDDLIGYALDIARISPMNDRQLQQYERNIKRYFRDLFETNLSIINSYKNYMISDKEKFLNEKQKG